MKNKSRSARKSHAIFLMALACTIVMNIMLSCKSNNANPQQPGQEPNKNNDSVTAITDTLQSQYGAARLQVDQLSTAKAELDSEIHKKDAEIAKLKGSVAHLTRSNKSLNGKLKKDTKFITSLQGEMSDKERSYAERLGLLENDKSSLSLRLDSLIDRYNRLKELGSVLHASNIRLMAIHLKHHGKKEKNTQRARKADVLKVYFDIDENRIAENGTKKLYLVIKGPDGKLLDNTAAGSGVTTASTGSPLNYSILKEMPLKQDESVKDVTADWKQDSNFKKGDYSIAIYNGGYKIGGGDVILN